MERLRAPELEPATAWLGTPRPIRLRELRGCVVILDFWTACCVNCMHVMPVLRDLERRFAGRPVVVIGVHSAKFPGEARPERVADAMARHGIEHPVVVDDGFAIWERYAIRSWPTLVVVRPDGTIAAVAPGEPDPRALDGLVRVLLAEAEAAGALAAGPPALAGGGAPPPGPLRFPGKAVAADDGRVAIADSGHHRVLIVDADGRVLRTIGSGRRGLAGGPLATARLDDPQGLAWEGAGALWICDARGHAVLRADLEADSLDIVAGTGSMGQAPLVGRAPGRATALRSPWDVALRGGRALVAMAGSHQLAAIEADAAGGWTVAALAGGGREALVDGGPEESCWAQPSGLALAGETLLVADSETSAIRALDLATGRTRTIVGAGLFEFGDADGPLATARLQHPLGVAATRAGIVVADTYNDRLRRIDEAAGAVTTLPTPGLREPGGVSVRPDGGLLVADSGNHRVLRVSAAGEVEGALAISGAPPLPAADEEPPPRLADAPALRWFDLTLPAPALAPGRAALRLRLVAPGGWKLNAGAPLRVALEVSRRSDLVTAPESIERVGDGLPDMSLEIPLAVAAATPEEVRSELLVRVDAVLCGGEAEVCAPSQAWLRVPLLLRADGGHGCAVELELAAPPE